MNTIWCKQLLAQNLAVRLPLRGDLWRNLQRTRTGEIARKIGQIFDGVAAFFAYSEGSAGVEIAAGSTVLGTTGKSSGDEAGASAASNSATRAS